MTDEEEFAARSQLNGRGKATRGSPPANGPRGPGQGPPRHGAFSQIKWPGLSLWAY